MTPPFHRPRALERIIADIKEKGGQSYLVGGAVIDLLREKQIKDWDIEVYRLSYETLQAILIAHGEPKLVGANFGVIKMAIAGTDYDFSIPRKENKAGIRHQDFSVELIPNMDPLEAAYRRDLTINAMLYDLEENTLIDPYHGQEDLKEGILRHTSPAFAEDPLRVLRIMQLLPRKGKSVAPETLVLCQSMVDMHAHLPKERLYEEWNKLLLKADTPSLGLQFLVDCGWIRWYPELDQLRSTPQDPDWHPEGNVWNHTLHVIDAASALRPKIAQAWQKGFMYGALLHDVGKAATTAADLTAHRHDEEGIPIARIFLERLTNNQDLSDKTLRIVQYHMRPGQLEQARAPERAWKRLHNRIPLQVIGAMSLADYAGVEGHTLDGEHPPSEHAFLLHSQYGEGKIPPILTGRDLLARGYREGPHIGVLLRRAYELQIEEGIIAKDDLLARLQT